MAPRGPFNPASARTPKLRPGGASSEVPSLRSSSCSAILGRDTCNDCKSDAGSTYISSVCSRQENATARFYPEPDVQSPQEERTPKNVRERLASSVTPPSAKNGSPDGYFGQRVHREASHRRVFGKAPNVSSRIGEVAFQQQIRGGELDKLKKDALNMYEGAAGSPGKFLERMQTPDTVWTFSKKPVAKIVEQGLQDHAGLALCEQNKGGKRVHGFPAVQPSTIRDIVYSQQASMESREMKDFDKKPPAGLCSGLQGAKVSSKRTIGYGHLNGSHLHQTGYPYCQTPTPETHKQFEETFRDTAGILTAHP